MHQKGQALTYPAGLLPEGVSLFQGQQQALTLDRVDPVESLGHPQKGVVGRFKIPALPHDGKQRFLHRGQQLTKIAGFPDPHTGL